jgi:hypothetical protein
MKLTNLYIEIFYGVVALALLLGSLVINPQTYNRLNYKITIACFAIGGFFAHSYIVAGSALLAVLFGVIRFRKQLNRNKRLHVILIADHDDAFVEHFLNYYRKDIMKYFPGFDFKIEQEYLVAIVLSEMESVGLVIAEIKNAETIRICLDYLVPKYRNTQLAKTFYNCELRCIDFLGYPNFYIEPQSRAHNTYLEGIGFKLVDGKYVNQCLKNT